MATIFLDEFTGSGAIDLHTPDIAAGGGTWFDPFSAAPTGPSAILTGGLLVVGPNVPEGDIQTVRYSDETGGVGFNFIGLPSSGTLQVQFVMGDSAALTNSTGFNRTIFEAGLVISIGGSTFVASLQQLPDGSFQLQGQPITLAPSTAYTLQIVYEPSTIRYYVGDFYFSESNFFGTPRGVTLAPTSAASFDSVEVNDTVPPPPPPPPMPEDYLYEEFTGDGPMQGRTPDPVPVTGLTWTDTTPVGSAETLDDFMVVGAGVPTNSFASARYGDFETSFGGPTEADVFAYVKTGPDLTYPVGATGLVLLFQVEFGLSPDGQRVSFAVFVDTDDSFVLIADDTAYPVTLEPDTFYELFVHYNATEHSFTFADASGTYPYAPSDPSAGYGATELYVTERASMDYYEVYGLLQQEVINDDDGMDEGVAEDATDPMNVAAEDVMEAGVGEDYTLLDGEVLPEDVREAGVGADVTDTQLNANQDARDAGVGSDNGLPVEPPVDAMDAGVGADRVVVFTVETAIDAGVAEDVTDPLGGVRLFFEDAFEDGVAGDATDTFAIRNANGLSAGIAADFTPNDYYALPRDNGVAADATNTTLRANQIALDAGIADATTDTRILQDVVDAGVAADATSLATSLTVRDSGVAADRALSSMTIAADVREAGVAADAALPLSFVDVREAGITADVVTTRRRTSQAARSDGVAADLTDPRLTAGALAVAAGVAADTTSPQLVAYSMVVEAGVGDDAGLFGRLYEAWVMNTQNTAMSRYTSLPFNSAAVIGGRVIGLGDGGFFELGGTTDAGKQIKALMKSGHLTLQADNIKRLDDVTVGYTSTGTLQVTVGAYGGKLKGRWTYTAPPVDAASPRGNRLTLGRGLQAKYYQFTIENTKGAAMSLDFARVISNEFKTRRF